jgi:hypothetical protein
MDEFNRIYGMFGVWRSDFIPGKRGEGPTVLVPMEKVVDRYVREKNHQKHKDKLLERWKEQLRADSVTETDIQLDKSAWEG